MDMSKIDKNAVFFHGSSEERMTRIDKPSYEHPFYVTVDIHYAMAFCTKSESSTGEWEEGAHKHFTPANDNFVYVVSLKDDAEFYDFRKDSHGDAFPIMKKIIPEKVIKFVRRRMQAGAFRDETDERDIYAFVAQLLGDAILPFFRFKGDFSAYENDYDSNVSIDLREKHKELTPMTYDEFFDVARMIHDFKISTSTYSEVHKVMAHILKALHKMGFKGIMTSEKDFNDEHYGTQVTTDYAIGIFDVSAMDIIGLVPMRYKWLKKITPIDKQANESANQKIKRYIKLYKSLARQ